MPINLTKHVKIWVHPEGIIPAKVAARLELQKQVRPADTLSLFVNKICLSNSKNSVERLHMQGIDIYVIEDELAQSERDDPLLKKWVNMILKRGQATKNILESVYASDLLRMMYVTQEKGLYSDTDVFFLPNDYQLIENTSYLFGTHHEGGMGADINVFGVDNYLMPTFYQALVNNLLSHKKEILGEQEIDELNVSKLILLPSVLYIPENAFENESAHTILNYNETSDNVIYQIEDHSWLSSEHEALLHDDGPDDLLNEASNRLSQKKGILYLNGDFSSYTS